MKKTDANPQFLQSPAGPLRLQRPGARGENLRAWDAADELLLEMAAARLTPGQRVAVVDDQFGALTLGLGKLAPVSVADSATLAGALALNAPSGAESVSPYSWLNAATAGEQPFDAIVLRIPRQLDYLAWLLRWVNRVLKPDGLLLAGGMIKHLPDRSAAVFGQLVQTDEVSPARKKARVIVCRPGTEETGAADWKGYRLADYDLAVDALPAVFSRESLDIGTRLLLPEVARAVAALDERARVLDLACGNGVLGLTALAAGFGGEVLFTDVSSQAVASARHNVEGQFAGGKARFCHSDGIPGDAGQFELILLNPPFHEGGVVGDHIALRLFAEASRHLAPGGRMLMVGNRHLGYHRSLRRYFGQVRQLAADPKFVVFEVANQPAGRS